MHRDMKVGFALGVLLVGVVGALFFRREIDPQAAAKLTPLRNAAEIDQQLSSQPHGPYILGPEDFSDGDEPSTAAAVPSKLPETPAPAYEVPDFLTPEDAAAQRDVLAAKSGSAPNPIPTTVTPMPGDPRTGEARSPAPIPEHNRSWEVASRNGRNATNAVGDNARTSNTTPQALAESGMETYVTRPGDTLSGISARFMGSSARYRELFEMNRHVLKSPDAVPEGVTLVVPVGSSDRDKGTARESGTVPSLLKETGGPRTIRGGSLGLGWDAVHEGAGNNPDLSPARTSPPASRPAPPAEKPAASTPGPVVIQDDDPSGTSTGSKPMFRASTRGRRPAPRIERRATELPAESARTTPQNIPSNPTSIGKPPSTPTGNASPSIPTNSISIPEIDDTVEDEIKVPSR